MKILFTLITCVLLTFPVKAQLIYNEDGDVVPFSLAEKYKTLIDTSKVNTCLLKSYNNDSLYREKNKDFVGSPDAVVAGFPIDTLINIRTKATKYKIAEGTLWLYKIESKTAEMLSINIKNLVLPEGAYICIFPKKTELLKKGPKLFLKKDITNPNFNQHQYGNQLFIEYFEPNKTHKKPDIIISRIYYMFTSPFKKKDIKSESNKSEPHLKSGEFGTAINNCQINVACSEVSNWAKESRSIIYINIFFFSTTGIPTFLNGTGFFINKANSYSDIDKPYFITAGHLFSYWELVNNVWKHIDLSSQIQDYEFRINYRDEQCDDPIPRTGQLLSKTSNIILKGNSYDKNVGVDATYEENEDFALLQYGETVSSLKKYNILYAGWTATPNFSGTGYGAIGHPNGDVQKVLIENGPGSISADGKNVKFYFDKGVGESGFSGAPAFNSSYKIVGWLCASQLGSCSDVGLNTKATFCGRFDRLHFNVAPYIDPTNQNHADDSEPTPPPPPTLPSHCTNCIPDADETGIDCGGSCLPCGMKDVRVLKTQADITSNNIAARYELDTYPDPGYRFEYISGTFNLNAGNSVQFKNNVLIKAGVNLKAAIIPELQSEPPRGCQAGCVSGANYFTPDGDGSNDYWVFSQSFVISYSLFVKDRYGTTIFTKANTPIFENGIVKAWDGSGANTNATTYYVFLTYTECNGTVRQTSYSVYLSGLKSLNLNDYMATTTNKEKIDSLDEPFKIIAYPNPTGGKVTVESCNCDLSFDCVLTDITGKVLIQIPNIIGSGEIDLSPYPGGMYLLRVKSGENVQLCKLIKK